MRSRTTGGTGKKVQRSGIGGRARRMAGAGPTDLPLGSRGLPAAYRHPGSLDSHEPCPGAPRVTIINSLVEAREERSHSERTMGTNMQDIVALCEGACQKRCHLRVPAEESEQEVTSCSSGSKARRQRKHGLPQTVQEGWGIGNENDTEPCPLDVHCSVGLRGISYVSPFRWCLRRASFPGRGIAYRSPS